MTSPLDPDWTKVLDLFDALAELPEANRREQLDAIATNQPELAAELAAMLEADQLEHGILDSSLQLIPGLLFPRSP